MAELERDCQYSADRLVKSNAFLRLVARLSYTDRLNMIYAELQFLHHTILCKDSNLTNRQIKHH